MVVKLNKELSDALKAAGADGLEVVDPETQRTYVLVERDAHRQAMDALRQRQARSAVAEGLAQMENGEGVPLDQAFVQMRTRLGFPTQQ